MIHTKFSFGCARASLIAVAVLTLVACGGGGGGSKGGTNPGGGSSATDTTAPDTTIVTKPDAATKATTAAFTFSASESGSSFEVSVDGGAFVATPANLNLTSVQEGEHTLSVRAIDAAKNVDASPATATWRVDLTAPTAQVFFPGAYSYTDASQVTLRGKLTDPTGSALKINGSDVTVAADGTWSSLVQVAAGDNTYALSTTDTLGSSDASAATIHVANNGPAISYVRGMDLDAAHNRLLLADYERLQILAVDLSTGRTSVFAGYDPNSAAKLQGVSNLVVDTTNNRVVAVDLLGDQLIAIDLDSKARSVLSDTTTSYVGSTRLVGTSGDFAGIALDLTNDVAYVTRGQDSVVHSFAGVIKIHLGTGVREVASGMGGGDVPTGPTVGSGYLPTSPSDIVVDTSTSPARLLVADGRRIISIDPSTGDGTLYFDGSSSLGYITRIKLDGQGKLLVSSGGSNVPHGVFAIDLNTPSGAQIIDTETTDGLVNGVYALAYDAVHERVYLDAAPTIGIYSAEISGGSPTLLSHANVGSGPKNFSPTGVVKSGNVLYLADSGQRALVKIDLATSNRTIVSSSTTGAGPGFGNLGNFALDETGNRILAPGYEGPNADALLSVDLTTGDRTVVSSNSVGGGPLLDRPAFVAWDGEGKRAIVIESGSVGDSTMLSIDQQGNRVVVSNLDTGSVNNTAPSGLVLDRIAGHAIVSLGVQYLVGTAYDVDLGTGDLTPYTSLQSLGLWMHPTERAMLTVDGRSLSLFDFNNAPRVVSGRDNANSYGSGFQMLYPNSVVADPDVNVAYITDAFNYGVIAIDLTTGERILISR